MRQSLIRLLRGDRNKGKVHSRRNYGQYKFEQCLLSFSLDPYVWRMSNLAPHPKRGAKS